MGRMLTESVNQWVKFVRFTGDVESIMICVITRLNNVLIVDCLVHDNSDEHFSPGSSPSEQEAKPPTPKVVMAPEAAAAASEDVDNIDDDDVTIEVGCVSYLQVFTNISLCDEHWFQAISGLLFWGRGVLLEFAE